MHLVGSYYTDISQCTVNKTLKKDQKNVLREVSILHLVISFCGLDQSGSLQIKTMNKRLAGATSFRNFAAVFPEFLRNNVVPAYPGYRSVCVCVCVCVCGRARAKYYVEIWD